MLDYIYSQIYYPHLVVGQAKENKLQGQLIKKALLNLFVISGNGLTRIKFSIKLTTDTEKGSFLVKSCILQFLERLDYTLMRVMFPDEQFVDFTIFSSRFYYKSDTVSVADLQKVNFLKFVKNYIKDHFPQVFEPLRDFSQKTSNFGLPDSLRANYSKAILRMFEGQALLFVPFFIKTLLDSRGTDNGEAFLRLLREFDTFYSNANRSTRSDNFKYAANFVVLNCVVDKLKRLDAPGASKMEFCRRFKQLL